MDSKFVLIFLLIAGAFATEDVEFEDNEEFERAEDNEDDTDFNAEAENAEDYDEVDEVDVKARDLKADEANFDDVAKGELHKFCADPANKGDPVCNV